MSLITHPHYVMNGVYAPVYKSYAFELPDKEIIHVGFDHRGTTIHCSENLSEKNFNCIISWLFEVCLENEKELCEKFLDTFAKN